MSLARLRRELLPGTLEHASHLPWYQKQWGKRWRAVREVEQLCLLPTLDKAEAAKHAAQLISRGALPSAGVVSSGTTGTNGPLLLVPRIAAEADAATAFLHAQWRDWTPPVALDVLRGIALEVRAMHHGVPWGPPAGGRLRMPWTYTGTAFRQFAQLLGARHAGKRITSLVIGAGALMPLTVWLLEQQLNPAGFKVRLIGTNGFRVSPFWRARLADVWNAQLWDNFSLSEFVTPAMECPDCGFHHWLTPPLVHEVLDVFTRAPLAKGVGELVLTGLYPFAQAMPLIRYRTGDLVEIGPRCRRADDVGFRPRGRVSQAVLDTGESGKPLLVCGQDVQELLEAESSVARHPHPVERLLLVKSNDIGAVKYRLAKAKRKIVLEIEVRYDPKVFVVPAAELTARIGSALRKISRRLVRLERAAEVSLEVIAVGPGTLMTPWSKF